MTTMKSQVSRENEMDRLSDLPDCLIRHILSSLKAKNAVQTSVLSRRWKHLWTCLLTLNFDCHSFGSITSFKKFVLHVLSRREPSNLHSLKFHTISSDKAFIGRVIRYAASHFVQEIYMDGTFNRAYGLLSLVSLRTLQLENCSLFGDGFASCVYLENLIINGCVVSETGKVIKTSAPRLVIVNMSGVTRISYSDQSAYMLAVSSPRLSSFCYQGICPSMLSMDACPLLDSVDFRAHISEHLDKQFVLPFLILQELIFHAKLLTMELKQGFMVKTISRNDDEMHAVTQNEATQKRRKLSWWLTDEKFKLFYLLWILQRYLIYLPIYIDN